MASPILRLATRLTRRTRTTAWAIAFACMVLVGGLALVDGLRGGIDSVTARLESAVGVYIRGAELLESRIPVTVVARLHDGAGLLRVHTGSLHVDAVAFDVVVASAERVEGGVAIGEYPLGETEVAVDAGLRERIEATLGTPIGPLVNLTVLGTTTAALPVAPPPPVRPELFPDGWAWVRAELLASISATEGPAVQAILSETPLDAGFLSEFGLSRLETIGAIGFFEGSVDEAAGALASLSLVIAVVIGLLVYAAMSLEVHQRAGEIRTLRSLGARPSAVAAIYEGQAITLALLGATLGSALGVILAHGIVSFAPLAGLPNLVVLGVPSGPVALAYAVAVLAGVIGGLVPSRAAALLARRPKEVGGF